MQQNNPCLIKEQLWKILSNNQGQLNTFFCKDIALNKKWKIEFKKEITDELFSVLESEGVIQNFLTESMKGFLFNSV